MVAGPGLRGPVVRLGPGQVESRAVRLNAGSAGFPCVVGNQQKHPPPPNGSFGSEPSPPQGRVCARLRHSAGRLFVVPTCFKLIGDRGSGIGGRGVGSVGLCLSGFASSVFRLPSSLLRLPACLFRFGIGHWSLVTGQWGLGSGNWAVGTGQWAFNGRILAYGFRLSTCRSRHLTFDFQP